MILEMILKTERLKNISPCLKHRATIRICGDGSSSFYFLLFISNIHPSFGISTIRPDENSNLHIITKIVLCSLVANSQIQLLGI
jgi:hypothetical protein